MPRQPNGSYNLPLPPVVSGDIVEAAWANTSLNDIAAALQDSLSRTGQGSMSEPILLVDGTKVAPGFGFVNESGTGGYRPSAGNLYFSVLGQDYLRLSSANGVQFTLDGTTWVDITGPVWDSEPIEFVDGTELLPSITFASETSTGIYWAGAGDLRITASGVDQFRVTDSGAQFSSDGGSTWNDPTVALWETAPMPFINGTVTEPSITFATDTDTGIYLAAAGDMRTTVAGADKFRVTADGPQTPVPSGDWQNVAPYADGEWTPGMIGTSPSSTAQGYWVRIGNMVTIFADLRWSTKFGGNTDPVVITGLPWSMRLHSSSSRMYVPTFAAFNNVRLSGRGRFGDVELFTRTMLHIATDGVNTLRMAVYIAENDTDAGEITTTGGAAQAYQPSSSAASSEFADSLVYPVMEDILSNGQIAFTLTYMTDDPFTTP